MDLMNIYNNSPIFIQNILTTIKGWTYKNRRYGTLYYKVLEEYKNRDYSNLKELENLQWKYASELIRYAVKHTEFYKKYYDGINIEEAIRKKDITMLPVLDKETVRKNLDKMYSISNKEGSKRNTSGSTGKSLCFLFRKDDSQKHLAYLDFFKIQHGVIPMKTKRASFGSSKIVPKNQRKNIFWRDNFSIKQRLYSGYHCRGDNVKYFIENLRKFKPVSIDGYPSALYELSRYILINKINLGFKPVAIFPTAETLLPHYKETIEKAFKCSVRNQYSSSEGAPFITECKCGNLHYCMDTGIIEFCDDGRMLVTCFHTHGTPLIRYDIGDRATLSSKKMCECGNAMPIVEQIDGRSIDYIESSKNGKFSAVYLSLVSAEFNNSVIGMQFIQNEKNSVIVNIVTDESYKDSMNQIIIDKLHYSLGDDMEIVVNKVPKLQKEKSGKVRFIINNLN